MADPSPPDERRTGPANLVTKDVTPELLLCTALVRSGLVDGAGASLVLCWHRATGSPWPRPTTPSPGSPRCSSAAGRGRPRGRQHWPPGGGRRPPRAGRSLAADHAELVLRAQAPTLPIAVGMIMARHGVDHDDALALLRARAFALSVSVPDLARDLAGGVVSLTELLGAPPDAR